jgi:hypothetical protein
MRNDENFENDVLNHQVLAPKFEAVIRNIQTAKLNDRTTKMLFIASRGL